jgi:phosphoenolpyruvate carboxykinase (ATP)
MTARTDHRFNVRYLANPSQDELRKLTLRHTSAVITTAYGSLTKITHNKARMAKWTYIIAPEGDKQVYSGGIIDPAKASPLIEKQREYIEKAGTVIAIQGYLGLGPRAVAVEWLYTPEGANIAGMQQVLSFPRDMIEPPDQLARPFRPDLRVIYTPDCFAAGMPGNQAIIVSLERMESYVMGPDYFGESKKGALRMLAELMYQRGGLLLHAGAKAVTVNGRRTTMTIMGLSGTGKTTTTFSKQGELVQPIQDDMVVLWPKGEISITENGCFAKTYGLTEESEPVIYRGTLSPTAWVENVYVDHAGHFDFSKAVLSRDEVSRLADVLIATGADPNNVERYSSGAVTANDVVDELGIPADGWDFVVWTQNGRSIIPMSAIENAADLMRIPPLGSMGILNRDEGPDAATPGIVKFATPEQAAAYFMLGETSKTSAAGKERGKTRSPFTQPFFPRAHGLQAARFRELVAGICDLEMWAMNTGYIGGDDRDEKRGEALKVKIRHSSAMIEGMLTGTIPWMADPDFGYLIPDVDHPDCKALLDKVPAEILQPRRFYAARGRQDLYEQWVDTMRKERRAFLEKYNVEAPIVRAACGD